MLVTVNMSLAGRRKNARYADASIESILFFLITDQWSLDVYRRSIRRLNDENQVD